jgi:hypothetical protein
MQRFFNSVAGFGHMARRRSSTHSTEYRRELFSTTSTRKRRVLMRAKLRAELDAAYFLLYGVSRPDVEYILSTFQGLSERESPDLGLPDRVSVLSAYDALCARR